MYSEILLPTDGSEAAQHVTPSAVDLASQFDARIHALYVIDSTAYVSLDAGSHQVIEALRENGKNAVQSIVDTAEDAGVDAVSEILIGAPHRRITDYAEDNGIDLIVMGTHGRTGLNRYLLGSVTERVVRTAKCPVLTVSPTDA